MPGLAGALIDATIKINQRTKRAFGALINHSDINGLRRGGEIIAP